MFRVAQRRRFGIDLMLFLAHVGGSQDAQTLGVGAHDAVFDAVVNHLDEVACAIWPAMQIALLGGTANFLASRRARYLVAHARSQPGEDWIKVLDYIVLAANHHAVTSLQAPNP